MLRFCLTIISLNFFTAICQLKSKDLLFAEQVKATNTLQSIDLAKKAFVEAIKHKDSYNSCWAAIFLGEAYRKGGDYHSAVHYDSLAVLQAKQLQSDTTIQQKAINNYARNFVEELQLDKAENILTKDSTLFTSHYSIETCLWYEMRALCNFNRIRIGDAIVLSRNGQDVARVIEDSVAIMHTSMMLFKYQSMLLRADSIDLAFNALAYFEKIENDTYVAQAANIIGYAFETTHNLDKAMEYYQRAI